MIRLHEFITKIRNCKTQAEERAEYQKEMAAIRESFAKNQENLRPRNVTKLLFINMSGQETNFGQMECLKLITANSLIEKRIGYLGLTQLFHEKSELLMMATNRIRIDLNSNNNNIVGLVLCVLSEICTAELAKDLHLDVLKCISNSSAYIRKKAILTSLKIIKRVPEYISEFLAKVSSCLEEKSHGVLLSCMAFLENVIQVDDSHVPQLVELIPKIGRAYRLIAQEHNVEYQIGGVQDPFLQVAILKFLRSLRKHSATFDKQLAEILVISHDSVCSRASSSLKNGANAVLFECFQCFMLLDPTPQLREMVANVLSKFISVKDANSKYLSLFNLNLMTKHDLKVVKTHRGTIFECLNENDILIRIMALDLLYVIAGPENSPAIVKDLLNVLLTANDEEFISELATKICLIVEKHSVSRRWHFDMILKVLVLADQAVKEESAKSLVYLIQATPQIQEYCMAKLFFSTAENPQNDALACVTLFLMGQLSSVLFKIKAVSITEQHVLDLVESIIFKAGIDNDTISYGLSSLLKLHQRLQDKQRTNKMIKSFQSHSDLQVQKRACEYVKLLEKQWDEDRKRQICMPIEAFMPTVETFRGIPVGDVEMDLDLSSLKMPNRLGVNYDEHIVKNTDHQENREVRMGKKDDSTQPEPQAPVDGSKPAEAPNKVRSLMDDDDQIFNEVHKPAQVKHTQPASNQYDSGLGGFSFDSSAPSQPQSQKPANDDPFGMMGLQMNSPTSPQVHNQGPSSQVAQQGSNFGGDLLGFGSEDASPTSTHSQPQNNSASIDFMGFGGPSNNQPQPQPPAQSANLGGFDFGGSSQPQQALTSPTPVVQGQNSGFNFDSAPSSNPQKALGTGGFQPITNSDPNKIMGYENQHVQIWIDCIKEGAGNTKLFTTYINKTNNTLTELTIQAAVLKHVKLTINPLSSTTLQPYSREVVHQTMTIANSMAGQKGVVMKMKLTYTMGNQKQAFQERISNFPAHV